MSRQIIVAGSATRTYLIVRFKLAGFGRQLWMIDSKAGGERLTAEALGVKSAA